MRISRENKKTEAVKVAHVVPCANKRNDGPNRKKSPVGLC